MFVAKVIGSVWATKKRPELEGLKFLVVKPLHLNTEPGSDVVIVADRIGAGVGENVICSYGKAGRIAVDNEKMPIEAAVIAIVDKFEIDSKFTDGITGKDI
jgi:ethanolamine utilization protein EutN